MNRSAIEGDAIDDGHDRSLRWGHGKVPTVFLVLSIHTHISYTVQAC